MQFCTFLWQKLHFYCKSFGYYVNIYDLCRRFTDNIQYSHIFYYG